MNFSFRIEGSLPGLNEIINKNRLNRYAGADQKRVYTKVCCDWIKAKEVPQFLNSISLDIYWVEKDNRRDPDNIRAGIKFILDALVLTGRIKGDSRRYINEIHDYFLEPNKKDPHIRISIKEVYL